MWSALSFTNPESRRFEIFNHWGYGNSTAPASQWLTWRQIVESFADWDGVAALRQVAD